MSRIFHGPNDSSSSSNVSYSHRRHQSPSVPSSPSTDSGLTYPHDHSHGNVAEQDAEELELAYPVIVKERGSDVNDRRKYQFATDFIDLQSPNVSQHRDKLPPIHSPSTYLDNESCFSRKTYMDPLNGSRQLPGTSKGVYNNLHIGLDGRTLDSSESRPPQKGPEISQLKVIYYSDRRAKLPPAHEASFHRSSSKSSDSNDTAQVMDEVATTSSGVQTGSRAVSPTSTMYLGSPRRKIPIQAKVSKLRLSSDDAEKKRQKAKKSRRHREGEAEATVQLKETLPSDLRGKTKRDAYRNAITHIISLQNVVDDSKARIEEFEDRIREYEMRMRDYEMRNLEYDMRIRHYEATIRTLREPER